jgi:hypothetical protein
MRNKNPSEREEVKGDDGWLTGEETTAGRDKLLRGEGHVGITTANLLYDLKLSTTAVGRRCRREGLPSGGSPPGGVVVGASIRCPPDPLRRRPHSLVVASPLAKTTPPRSVPRLERCFLPGPECEERVGLGRYWILGGG